MEIIIWLAKKSYWDLKEYFFPTAQLPDEIMRTIESEAHDIVWKKDRAGDEQNLADYYEVLTYLYKKKYDQHFSEQIKKKV